MNPFNGRITHVIGVSDAFRLPEENLTGSPGRIVRPDRICATLLFNVIEMNEVLKERPGEGRSRCGRRPCRLKGIDKAATEVKAGYALCAPRTPFSSSCNNAVSVAHVLCRGAFEKNVVR